MKKLDVVGLGVCGADLVTQVERFPKGDKVTSTNLKEYAGGVTANNVTQAAKLGLKTAFCGAIGKDIEGKKLLNTFKKDKVTVHAKMFPTTQKAWIAIDQKGERQVYVFPNASYQLKPEHVINFVGPIAKAKHMHTEVGAIKLNTAIAGARIAKKYGTKVFVDIDGDIDYLLDIAKIGNMEEFLELMEHANVVKITEGAIKSKALLQKIVELTNVVAITYGSKGCRIIRKKEIYDIPGYKVNVADSTGAGDAFMGGLSFALLKGMHLQEAGYFANACGAYACTGIGARHLGTQKDIWELQNRNQ